MHQVLYKNRRENPIMDGKPSVTNKKTQSHSTLAAFATIVLAISASLWQALIAARKNQRLQDVVRSYMAIYSFAQGFVALLATRTLDTNQVADFIGRLGTQTRKAGKKYLGIGQPSVNMGRMAQYLDKFADNTSAFVSQVCKTLGIESSPKVNVAIEQFRDVVCNKGAVDVNDAAEAHYALADALDALELTIRRSHPETFYPQSGRGNWIANEWATSINDARDELTQSPVGSDDEDRSDSEDETPPQG